jgi:2-isopropylmalate synthase
VQVSCGDHLIPTATVTIRTPDGQEVTEVATGTGPVDATYRAVDKIVQVPARLAEYAVQAVTAGIDAIGEVTVRVESDGRTFSGHGASTDIIVASAKAYMNALNKVTAYRKQAERRANGHAPAAGHATLATATAGERR